MKVLLLPIILLLNTLFWDSTFCSKAAVNKRRGRIFSLFNVVRFKNEGCRAASGNGFMGTCFTADECNRCGGVPDGNCASGFGICCVIIQTGCGGTVEKNCTVIQSIGFPLSDQTLGQCNYNFRSAVAGIAQVRLDFINTVLSVGGGSNGFPGECGGPVDALTVISPVGSPENVICGTLTGQHIYIDSNGQAGTLGMLNINKNLAAFNRRYRIKVTYIHTNSPLKAPRGCAQYFTELSDTLMSYNFAGGQMLENQLYSHCIRQEEGFCSYSVTQVNPLSFMLSNVAKSMINCKALSYLLIPRPHVMFNARVFPPPPPFQNNNDYNCGKFLDDSIGYEIPGIINSDEVTPFAIGFRTLKSIVPPGKLVGLSGFNVRYTQNKC